MMVRLVQWRALIGIFSCQISGTSTNNRYNRQKVWFYAWKFASTLSLSRRGAYYCHNSSIYFCSFTLPWRYWTKPRTKETKKKDPFPSAIGILIVYLLITSWNLLKWKHIFQCINTISYVYQKHTWILQHLMGLLEIDGNILVHADHSNNIKRGGVCIY